jgi:hypothetical protein
MCRCWAMYWVYRLDYHFKYKEKQTWIDSTRRAIHFPESRREVGFQEQVPHFVYLALGWNILLFSLFV